MESAFDFASCLASSGRESHRVEYSSWRGASLAVSAFLTASAAAVLRVASVASLATSVESIEMYAGCADGYGVER